MIQLGMYRNNTVMRPNGSQGLAFTGTSAQSAAIASHHNVVRLVATQDCFIAIGANPTATTGDMLLPAGVVEYIGIHEGEKIAAIQSTTGGTLNITEMTQ